MGHLRLLVVLGILLASVSPARSAVLLSEGFEDITSLPGWATTNNSAPLGTTGWFQGNSGIFPAQAGGADSYIAANFNNAALGGDISNWLFSPILSLANGDTLSFFTRSTGVFPDRLELRLSTNGASVDVGIGDASVGDFTTLLLTINPTLSGGRYPGAWTQFVVTLGGLGGPTTGRYAFRYFVPDTAVNADYIGIDTVTVEGAGGTTPVPHPATLLTLGLAVAAFAASRVRRAALLLSVLPPRSR